MQLLQFSVRGFHRLSCQDDTAQNLSSLLDSADVSFRRMVSGTKSRSIPKGSISETKRKLNSYFRASNVCRNCSLWLLISAYFRCYSAGSLFLLVLVSSARSWSRGSCRYRKENMACMPVNFSAWTCFDVFSDLFVSLHGGSPLLLLLSSSAIFCASSFSFPSRCWVNRRIFGDDEMLQPSAANLSHCWAVFFSEIQNLDLKSGK